jgi:hypothetical protein
MLFKAKELFIADENAKLPQSYGDSKSVPDYACRLKPYRHCRAMYASQLLTVVRRLRMRNTINELLPVSDFHGNNSGYILLLFKSLNIQKLLIPGYTYHYVPHQLLSLFLKTLLKYRRLECRPEIGLHI